MCVTRERERERERQKKDICILKERKWLLFPVCVCVKVSGCFTLDTFHIFLLVGHLSAVFTNIHTQNMFQMKHFAVCSFPSAYTTATTTTICITTTTIYYYMYSTLYLIHWNKVYGLYTLYITTTTMLEFVYVGVPFGFLFFILSFPFFLLPSLSLIDATRYIRLCACVTVCVNILYLIEIEREIKIDRVSEREREREREREKKNLENPNSIPFSLSPYVCVCVSILNKI